jgi:hypothetical protein
LPSAVDSVFFENFVIKLPAYLKFEAGNVNSQNEVILNRGFKVSEGFMKMLKLQKLDFGAAGLVLDNGVLKLNDEVSIQGKVYIKGTNLNASQLNAIDIKPTISVGEISISVVEAELSPNIEPISEVVTLNLPEFIKEEGTILDIQNPLITIETGNTTGIPVQATLTLIPKKNGAIIPNASVTTQLTIAAATVPGKFTWSRFWISKSNEGVSDSYQAVIIPALPNLFKLAPDEVEIRVQPIVSGNKHTIDLYALKNH